MTLKWAFPECLGYCILQSRTHPGATAHAHRRIAQERPGLRGRGEGELQPRRACRHQAISVSEPALRMRNGQVSQVRLPDPARGRTPAGTELEGKKAARRVARSRLPAHLPALDHP